MTAVAFEPAGPRSLKIRCRTCGRTGYPEGAWKVPCQTGHAPCPRCGRLLVVKLDGNPRIHTRCPALAAP